MVLVLRNERYRTFHGISPDMFACVPPEQQRLLTSFSLFVCREP